MTDKSHEDRLRRACKKHGLIFKKTRRPGGPGSEHGPYHVLKPFGNLAISAAHYPNGMTLREAEDFVQQHRVKAR